MIEKIGQRVYLRDLPFARKDEAKAALGCRWDPDQRSWWVGLAKAAQAEAFMKAPPATAPGTCTKCGKACDPKYATCYGCKPTPSQCSQCGRRPGPRGWPRIYRNGICSDCYSDAYDD